MVIAGKGDGLTPKGFDMGEEYIVDRSFTKREFIRLCSLGLGGCAVGVSAPGWLTSSVARSAPERGQDDRPGRWSKEALFYEKHGENVRCMKCPHACLLVPDQHGICRNRVNYDGTLYTIAYGNPCAVHIDPIEKKPFYHFLPSTRAFSIAAAGCSFR